MLFILSEHIPITDRTNTGMLSTNTTSESRDADESSA